MLTKLTPDFPHLYTSWPPFALAGKVAPRIVTNSTKTSRVTMALNLEKELAFYRKYHCKYRDCFAFVVLFAV